MITETKKGANESDGGGFRMIPFVLGIITGFMLAVLLMVIYAVAISSGYMSRKEEEWENKDEN